MAVKRSDFIVRLYSQISSAKKNKHVILKTRNKYSQKQGSRNCIVQEHELKVIVDKFIV